MKMILKLLFMSDFWLDITKFEKCKAFKKDLSKELVPGVWHPTTWWDWCMSEDEKKIWIHFLLIKLESGKS